MPPLLERFLKYLKVNTVEVPEKWVTKNKLQQLAFDAGYQSSTIKRTFRELEEHLLIGAVWNGNTRQMEYMFYNLTPEELKKKQEDNDWFDSL